jgi:hypothetical protein
VATEFPGPARHPSLHKRGGPPHIHALPASRSSAGHSPLASDANPAAQRGGPAGHPSLPGRRARPRKLHLPVARGPHRQPYCVATRRPPTLLEHVQRQRHRLGRRSCACVPARTAPSAAHKRIRTTQKATQERVSGDTAAGAKSPEDATQGRDNRRHAPRMFEGGRRARNSGGDSSRASCASLTWRKSLRAAHLLSIRRAPSHEPSSTTRVPPQPSLPLPPLPPALLAPTLTSDNGVDSLPGYNRIAPASGSAAAVARAPPTTTTAARASTSGSSRAVPMLARDSARVWRTSTLHDDASGAAGSAAQMQTRDGREQRSQ